MLIRVDITGMDDLELRTHVTTYKFEEALGTQRPIHALVQLIHLPEQALLLLGHRNFPAKIHNFTVRRRLGREQEERPLQLRYFNSKRTTKDYRNVTHMILIKE